MATPADTVFMPGINFGAQFPSDPHPERDSVIRLFEEYTEEHRLPISLSTEVTQIQKREERGFVVITPLGDYICENVICCIGPRHFPYYPREADRLLSDESIRTLHSSDYRTPNDLNPAKKVLVVGSGASALSIVLDLVNNEMSVTLACGYSDEVIRQKNAHLYVEGKQNGVVPSLSQLSEMGVRNVGRFVGYMDGILQFALDTKLACIDKSAFDAIIFATGYNRSFDILNRVLSLGSNSASADPMNTKEVVGLYVAGLPRSGQQTVIISEGSKHAENIVTQIANEVNPPNNVRTKQQEPKDNLK